MSALSKKKVLLMGTQGAGKTSMRAIIFANYIASDTQRLGATQQIENHQVRFLGNLTLWLWDCGWQEKFKQSYLTTQRAQVFSNAEVLVYVFDVSLGPQDQDKELEEFRRVMAALKEFSPSCKVFCLVHKMDLINEEKRASFFRLRTQNIEAAASDFKPACFASSIWDETLYRAWSSIVYSMIPNARELEAQLDRFAELSESTEVILFERATFLVIAHTATSKMRKDLQLSFREPPKPSGTLIRTATTRRTYDDDPHRFEKISNIIKQFKLSCSKAQGAFRSLELLSRSFCAFLEEFTANTYVLVIVNDPTIYPQLTLSNIRAARHSFEPLVASS